MNEELLDQSKQIQQSGEFLGALVDSLAVGLVVVDKDLTITMWNRTMEDLFGLRAGEGVGQPLGALDIGLPVELLIAPLRDVATAHNSHPLPLSVRARDRLGKPIDCRITIDTLDDVGTADREQRFVVLVDAANTPDSNSNSNSDTEE